MTQLSPESIRATRQYHAERAAKQRAKRLAEQADWQQRVCIAITDLAPGFAALQRVYLFGSLRQPGRFRPDSDIDLAVECNDLETESLFWRALERTLQRDVDLRPLVEPILSEVARYGELIYERKSDYSNESNP